MTVIGRRGKRVGLVLFSTIACALHSCLNSDPACVSVAAFEWYSIQFVGASRLHFFGVFTLLGTSEELYYLRVDRLLRQDAVGLCRDRSYCLSDAYFPRIHSDSLVLRGRLDIVRDLHLLTLYRYLDLFVGPQLSYSRAFNCIWFVGTLLRLLSQYASDLDVDTLLADLPSPVASFAFPASLLSYISREAYKWRKVLSFKFPLYELRRESGFPSDLPLPSDAVTQDYYKDQDIATFSANGFWVLIVSLFGFDWPLQILCLIHSLLHIDRLAPLHTIGGPLVLSKNTYGHGDHEGNYFAHFVHLAFLVTMFVGQSVWSLNYLLSVVPHWLSSTVTVFCFLSSWLYRSQYAMVVTNGAFLQLSRGFLQVFVDYYLDEQRSESEIFFEALCLLGEFRKTLSVFTTLYYSAFYGSLLMPVSLPSSGDKARRLGCTCGSLCIAWLVHWCATNRFSVIGHCMIVLLLLSNISQLGNKVTAS